MAESSSSSSSSSALPTALQQTTAAVAPNATPEQSATVSVRDRPSVLKKIERPKKTGIWQHCTLWEDQKTQKRHIRCNHCHIQWLYHSATSNTITHLRAHHSININVNPRKRKQMDSDANDSDIEVVKSNTQPVDIEGKESVTDDGNGVGEEQVTLRIAKKKLRQTTMTEIIGSKEGRRIITDKVKKELMNKIVKLLAIKYVAINTITSNEFAELCSVLNPDFRVPCDKTIKGHIFSVYEDTVARFKSFVVSAGGTGVCGVHFSTDMWTGASQTSYLALTAHFINADWKLMSLTLACRQFDEITHSGKNIATFMCELLKELKLDKQIFYCVSSDSGANVVVALRNLRDWSLKQIPAITNIPNTQASRLYDDLAMQLLGSNRIPCVAHQLNLAVKTANEILGRAISKVKDFVMIFTTSPKQMETLTRLTKANLTDLRLTRVVKPFQDCPTRWNSQFYMIQRFCLLKGSFALYRREILNDKVANADIINKCRKFWPTADELLAIDDYRLIMMPLERTSCILSGQSYSTLSLYGPVMSRLMGDMEKISTKITTDVGKKCFEKLQQEVFIHRALDPMQQELADLASFIDPRFSTMSAFSTKSVATMKSKLLSFAVTFYQLAKKYDESVSSGSSSLQTSEASVSLTVPPQSDEFDFENDTDLAFEDRGNPTDDLEALESVDDMLVELNRPLLQPPGQSRYQGNGPDNGNSSANVHAQAHKQLEEQIYAEISAYSGLSNDRPIAPDVVLSLYDELQSKEQLKLIQTSAKECLQWWADRERLFPRLTKIAKVLLAIPASSAPSERVFSAAGLLLTPDRTSLSPLLVDQLITIRSSCSAGLLQL
eukprot:GILK01006218.1.p1 GENE.GILK01006218.1~~GILK01006218.1.p1  ORF type:complete len:847 (+),score=91.20 GILK01006218.1:36-2543(+)